MSSGARAKLIALIDMDGTVADYSSQMVRDLERLRSPNEAPIEGDLELAEITQHLEARMSLIKGQPEWWFNLPAIPLGLKVVNIFREFGFDLHIATKGPSRRPQAWAEKVRWCNKIISDATIHITEEKSMLYGKVLFDDWPAYVLAWLEWRPRGLVVMPAKVYNAHLEGHPNIIRVEDTPHDMERLRECLRQRLEAWR